MDSNDQYDLTPDYIDAYQEGEKACMRDLPKRSNPYSIESDEKRQGWNAGWEAARNGR